jgi:hypothetical protein
MVEVEWDILILLLVLKLTWLRSLSKDKSIKELQ